MTGTLTQGTQRDYLNTLSGREKIADITVLYKKPNVRKRGKRSDPKKESTNIPHTRDFEE